MLYVHDLVRLLDGTVDAYLHRDQLNSVRAITNAIGLPIEQRVYDPFGSIGVEDLEPGALLEPTETVGFIGERFDADSGLQYLNARYYDPELAMFIQPDWWEVTKQGVGTNRFSYSGNDPLNKLDPLGNSYSDTNATLDNLDDDNDKNDHVLGGDALDNLGIEKDDDSTAEEIEEANRRGVRPGQPQSPSARFEAMRDQVLRNKIDAARERLGLGPATYAQSRNFQPSAKTNAQLQNQLNTLQNQIRSQPGSLGTTTPTTTGTNQAPKTAVPNSIYEQYNNGVLNSRTFYDGNGCPFSRQDFSHPHGGMQPHQHNFNFNGYGQPISPTTVTPLNDSGWQ